MSGTCATGSPVPPPGCAASTRCSPRRAVQPAQGDWRTDHRGAERQGRPRGPACHRPDPPGPGTGPRSAVPVPPTLRRRRPSRTALQRLATTVETWWPEILAFLHTWITDAGSEGTNQVIKTVTRDAYGFRNPVNQRLRTRRATTRRARGHLDAR
ncbi:transposase [Streptomyces sp. NPDC001020]